MQQTSQRKPLFNRLRSLVPSPGNVIFTVLMIGITLWVQTARATETTTMPYRGQLANADGTPLSGSIPMELKLYNQATGGDPAWEESRSGANEVQVSDGLFDITLGSITPINRSTITDNSELYLGISIDGDDELSPRVRLDSMVLDLYRMYAVGGDQPDPATIQGIKQVDLGTPMSYPVSATRYHIEATKAQVNNTVPLDMDIFNELCKDKDGCTFTLGMRDWDNKQLGNVASRGPYHLFYSETSTHWRISSGDRAGMDSNGTVQHIYQAWGCFFTDGEYVNRTGTDSKVQLGLLNWSGTYNDSDMVCTLTIDD